MSSTDTPAIPLFKGDLPPEFWDFLGNMSKDIVSLRAEMREKERRIHELEKLAEELRELNKKMQVEGYRCAVM